MKSRRHRAIDRSSKELPMRGFIHSKKDSKCISKGYKVINKKYYEWMKKLVKETSFNGLVEYYKKR